MLHARQGSSSSYQTPLPTSLCPCGTHLTPRHLSIHQIITFPELPAGWAGLHTSLINLPHSSHVGSEGGSAPFPHQQPLLRGNSSAKARAPPATARAAARRPPPTQETAGASQGLWCLCTYLHLQQVKRGSGPFQVLFVEL